VPRDGLAATAIALVDIVDEVDEDGAVAGTAMPRPYRETEGWGLRVC